MNYFMRKWYKFINEQKDSHIQYNEPPTEGLRREVKEETGLIVTDYNELHHDGNLIFFWGRLPKGNIVLSSEHSAYHLLNIDEIGEKGYKISDILFNAVKKAYELIQKA